MSRNHHRAVETASTIQHDIQFLSKEEIETTYGIQINDDGTVYDSAYDKTFANIGEWIEFETEFDEMDYSDEFGHGKQDYYDDF